MPTAEFGYTSLRVKVTKTFHAFKTESQGKLIQNTNILASYRYIFRIL